MGRWLAMAALLLTVTAAWPARADEEITFRLVIDGKLGPSVVEGRTTFSGDHFYLQQWTFGQFIDLSGQLKGDIMAVSGHWGGDYMRGEGGIVDGKFAVSMRPTGEIFAAFISLSVPPSVLARLRPPPGATP